MMGWGGEVGQEMDEVIGWGMAQDDGVGNDEEIAGMIGLGMDVRIGLGMGQDRRWMVCDLKLKIEMLIFCKG